MDGTIVCLTGFRDKDRVVSQYGFITVTHCTFSNEVTVNTCVLKTPGVTKGSILNVHVIL